ncbi:MAG: LacI family DNA-binding transcriptional regulator [Devosia sp.]
MGTIKRQGSGDRPVRVQDVARVAGVSPITVSRALSNPDLVRPETRARVAAAVAETGYVVNSLASSLRSGRSNVIAVFVSNFFNQLFAAAMQGCADALEGSGYHMLVAQTAGTAQNEREVVESVMPFRPAAFVFGGRVQSDATRERLIGLNVPVVETWTAQPEPVDVLVTLPATDIGRLMGEHFGKRRFKRIAYAGAVKANRGAWVESFRSGLAAEAAELALVVDLDVDPKILRGMEGLERVLRDLPDCDAIFFGSDLLAVGAMLEARKRGIRIPEDIAVAGLGDLDFAAHLQPSLTTVRVSGYEIGRRSGQMLLARLRTEAVPERISTVPVELVERDSTRQTGPV